MDDLYLLYTRKDRDWSLQLQQGLTERMCTWIADTAPDVSPPKVQVVEGLERLENLEPLGPLSLILLVLPKRKFSLKIRQQIADFQRRPGGSQQILPISCEPGRDRPHVPLNALRSFPMYPLSDDLYKQLLTWLLNQIGLRLPSSARSVFISYRTADGRPVAERLEQGLAERGYRVFRDDKRDDDGLPLLRISGDVQKQIHNEIPKHSLLLVIDSPLVVDSAWVLEEINTALTAMRPILPVVIESPTGSAVPQGGRFYALREMQAEVRLPSLSLNALQLPTLIGDHFFATLEGEILKILLGYYRISRQLVHATEQQFLTSSFNWYTEAAERLLYRVEQPRPSVFVPNRMARVLVQCSPYRAVLRHSLLDTVGYLRGHTLHFDCGFLVHSLEVFQPNRLELITDIDPPIYICYPDQIPDALEAAYG